MRRIVTFGVTLVAALSVAGASAVSVSATGHEFVANKTGKTKGVETDAQVFKTGAGTLECTTVTGVGKIEELKSAIHKETLTYSGCSAFGYSNVKISPAHFEYSANGSARLEETVIIKPEGSGCEILIEPQTVEGMSYKNEAGKVTAKAGAFKIVSIGTGKVCGAENKEGSYTGSVEAELENGTVEWK